MLIEKKNQLYCICGGAYARHCILQFFWKAEVVYLQLDVLYAGFHY